MRTGNHSDTKTRPWWGSRGRLSPLYVSQLSHTPWLRGRQQAHQWTGSPARPQHWTDTHHPCQSRVSRAASTPLYPSLYLFLCSSDRCCNSFGLETHWNEIGRFEEWFIIKSHFRVCLFTFNKSARKTTVFYSDLCMERSEVVNINLLLQVFTICI